MRLIRYLSGDGEKKRKKEKKEKRRKRKRLTDRRPVVTSEANLANWKAVCNR